jgi:hypothetical protein
MKNEHVPETDQQYKEAESQQDKATTALLQTIRETFITLHYPTKSGLGQTNFKMEFTENKFNGEEQVIAALKYEMKFEDFSTEDTIVDDIAVELTPSKKKVDISDSAPLEYTMNKQKECNDTMLAYDEFTKLKLLPGTYIRNFTVTIVEKDNINNYMEITTASVPWDTASLQTTLEIIRDSAFAGKDVEVQFAYKTILFTTGEAFKQWVELNKLDAGELSQKGVITQ